MSPLRILLASTAIVSLAGLAQAQTAVPVSHFDSVELEGGGHVVLKHGDVQRVMLIKGSTQFTTFETGSNSHKLTIKTCNRDCPEQYDLEIEITTPDIPAVAIEGGGHIESDGAFPGQHAVTAAVHGGGNIDLRSINADDATAAVDGGGHIELRAEKHLTAAVNGGGHIGYAGNPEVTEAVNGGGSVTHRD
ncbi:MAG TPA: DUF2807 domain-containing protein [Rhizomicrobium sp.]|jgi:hypothetical protein